VEEDLGERPEPAQPHRQRGGPPSCYARSVAIAVQLLMSPGCGNGARALALLRELLPRLAPGAGLEIVTVATAAAAERHAFPGSPTVRVDGLDVDPARPAGVGLG